MATIDLKLLNFYYLKTKKSLLHYKGETVLDIIQRFINEYKNKLDENMLNKDKNGLSSDTIILVNGRNIEYLEGMDTKLSNGDRIVLSLRMAGG
ncbi:MAG: MoaD/ThiS family protein [Promethearchaeia archaeon]